MSTMHDPHLDYTDEERKRANREGSRIVWFGVVALVYIVYLFLSN